MPRIKKNTPRESLHSLSAWGALFAALLVLCFQTVRVHMTPDPRVQRQSERQYWAQVPISTSRGDIRDRFDVPLAISVPSVSFFIDPQYWDPSNADVLTKYFGEATARKFSKNLAGRFHWVVRKAPEEKAKALMAQKTPGLFTVTESHRRYPHGELASHVIGFCDIDDSGLSGVELAWNNVLFSPPQSRLFIRDARGKLLDLIGSNAGIMRSGAGSIRLTLDSKIQQIVEWKIKEGAEAAKAKWAAGVCLDPRTGEVLALASYPMIDLNDRESFKNDAAMRNNVTGRVYEPGSTFKPIILGIAMEMAKASRAESFMCRGRLAIADGVIRDVSVHGKLNLQGLIVKSCNTGMATIGNRLSSHATYAMLRQFGFGRRTDVEIAGEEEGLLRPPESWLGMARANVAIGQGLAVTPLQLAVAVAAIANGGDLLKPYVIDEVKNASGKVIHQGKRRVRTTVLGPDTCEWLREAMRLTVATGTGRGASTELVEIAGKTGTAQIASGGRYGSGQYVSSFVGFWPARNPEYVLLVVLGEPTGARYYGGEIAAPVFKSIVEDVTQISTAQRRRAR